MLAANVRIIFKNSVWSCWKNLFSTGLCVAFSIIHTAYLSVYGISSHCVRKSSTLEKLSDQTVYLLKSTASELKYRYVNWGF